MIINPIISQSIHWSDYSLEMIDWLNATVGSTPDNWESRADLGISGLMFIYFKNEEDLTQFELAWL